MKTASNRHNRVVKYKVTILSQPKESDIPNMKKSTRLLTLLLTITMLCSLCFSSCGGNETETGVAIPNDMSAVVSEAKDYDFVYPSDWLVETTVGMTSVYAEDNAQSNVTVCANEITGEITSIEGYWEMFSEQFSATFADFAMIDAEPADVVIGSAYEEDGNTTEGLKYRYTATVGDVKYQWMQVLFVRGATLYILTYTSTVDAYEENLDDVNDIIAYFSVR